MEKLGNPAALGLTGFGMTTVLLNIHNLVEGLGMNSPEPLFPLGSMILAMGIFYGGLAQVIAGIMEYRNQNTFATTAFTSYGLFWLSLVGLVMIPQLDFLNASFSYTNFAFGWYLFMWGLFTFWMFIGTFRESRALQVVFGTLFILFWLLAAAEWTGIKAVLALAGAEGILCGLSAMYTAAAIVLNDLYRKTVLPICPVETGQKGMKELK